MFDPLPPRARPLRRPKGFEPAVQRWSLAFPARQQKYFVDFYGVQGPGQAAIEESGFLAWIAEGLTRADGPTAHDHARHIDADGQLTHIVATYWLDEAQRAAWQSSAAFTRFWQDEARLVGPCGIFRECLSVPVGQQETLYWQDYRAAFSASDEVAFFPTPYCGYYGAMRDRIPLSGTDDFASSAPPLAPKARDTRGRRWVVRPPENLAIIRSATFWGACDAEQLEDYRERLRLPLERGMRFLQENPVETGCCSLRFQQSLDDRGRELPEAHALGIFLSLSHLENWAEGHPSHDAIFTAAIERYRKYGRANQLRTWHEVFVLPAAEQLFEYVNCSPRTGLLPWFEATSSAA